MTAVKILETITNLGGRVYVENDRLRVEAPKGILKPELKEAIRERKPELLALLQTKREGEALEARLEDLGIRIAIDKKTGEACLVFSASDAEAARSVAEVCRPFERSLTDVQKRELLADLEYFERLVRRRAAKADTVDETKHL